MSNRIEDRSEIHASPLPFLQRLPSSNAVQDDERGRPNLGFSSRAASYRKNHKAPRCIRDPAPRNKRRSL
jgi:hypothetical protein